MLQTKICIPRIGTGNIRRIRVEEKLQKLSSCRFAIISAPAGYGKTTAIIDYINRDSKKCAWVSIDADDNDPSRLWRYVITSISTCTGLNDLTGIPTDEEHVKSRITVDLLLETIENYGESFVIVLDDYHLINNAVIDDTIEHFIKYLPDKVSVILTSRIEPPRGLALLCIKGFGFILGREDLAFNEENTKEYFAQIEVTVSDQENHDVYRYSEGWPAGIFAAAMQIQARGNRKETFAVPSQLDQNIAFYLENEVFDRWSEETKEFLVQTSFLDKLCGPLCDHVTGRQRSADLLRTLSKSNAFVVPLDQNNKWFRYHHLFQDFLLERLDKRGEEEKRRLYLLAADWFSEQDMQEDVIKWLLMAKAYSIVAPLLDQHIATLINRETQEIDIQMLLTSHKCVPEEYYQDIPEMFSWRSWVSFMNEDVEGAKQWIHKARKSANRIKDRLDQAQKALLEVYLLYVELNIDIYERDIMKMTYRLSKMRSCKVNTTPTVGDLNWYESSLLNTRYGFMGRLQKASIYATVESELVAYMGETSAYIATIIAEAAYEQNKLETAIQTLINFMPFIVKRSGAIVPAFILQARLKLAAGDFAAAFSAIGDARLLLHEKSNSVWSYHLDVFSAKMYLMTGGQEHAKACIRSDRLGLYDAISRTREPELVVYARMLINEHQLGDALILLKRLEQFARTNDRMMSLMEVLCLTAICLSKKVDYQNAMMVLKEALETGSKEGYIRVFVDEGAAMAALLERYIAQHRNGGVGAHLSYARNLLKLTNEHIGRIESLRQSDGAARFAPELLTKTEQEIMRYIMNQASNQEIADDLFLSINTIKKYNARLFDKLGVSNRYEAIQKVKQLGILD